MKRALAILIAVLATVFAVAASRAQTGDPPDCTNGDCPPPPPDCTNGDCPPPPPDCTNGDCPPPDPSEVCCCVGENQPGDVRVCCCRSEGLSTVRCRQSLVLDYGYPDAWHQTLAEAILDGTRPRSCGILLARFCDPPIEQVCVKAKGKKVCWLAVKTVCRLLDKQCQYRFCGPDWFPYGEAAPDPARCEWWSRIRPCANR